MVKNGPVIAVLASGAASRFGGGKLHAHLDGRPLAAHAIETAHTQGIPVAIIVREHETALWRESFHTCQIIANPIAASGIGTSIRCAAEWALSSRASGIILLLADMPFVSESLVEKLVEAATKGQRAACHYPEGTAGIPAAFPASDYPALAQIGDHEGAKHLLGDRTTLILHPPHQTLIDIDTQTDLAIAAERTTPGWA